MRLSRRLGYAALTLGGGFGICILAQAFGSAFGTTDSTFGGAAPAPAGFAIADLGGTGDQGVDLTTGSDDSIYSLGYLCNITSTGAASCQNGGTGTGTVANVVTHHLASSGAVDTTFGSGGKLTLSDPSVPFSSGGYGAVLFDVDDVNGRIYLAGFICPATGNCQVQVARFKTDGTLDSSYGSAGLSDPIPTKGNVVFTGKIVLSPSLQLYVSGADANQVAGVLSSNGSFLARLNSAGKLDLSFNASGTPGYLSYSFGLCDSSGSMISFGANGSIYVPGAAQTTCSSARTAALAKVLPTGVLDTTFGSSGIAKFAAQSTDANGDTGFAAQEQANKQVAYSFGSFGTGGFTAHAIVVNADGSQDTTVTQADAAYAVADNRFTQNGGIVFQASGKLLMSGSFQTTAGDSDMGLTRLGGDPTFAHAARSFSGTSSGSSSSSGGSSSSSSSSSGGTTSSGSSSSSGGGSSGSSSSGSSGGSSSSSYGAPGSGGGGGGGAFGLALLMWFGVAAALRRRLRR